MPANSSPWRCAALFAVWIVYQGEYANRLHPIPFTTVQMAVIVVVCLPPSAAQGVGHLTGLALFAAAFTGVLCSAVALSLRVCGQRRLAPSRTALILMMEPVFAGIAGYVSGERLTALELTGAAVILAGIAVAELAATSRARRDRPGSSLTSSDRPTPPVGRRNSGARTIPPVLSIDATAAILGHACWLEARCFELLGGWVPVVTEPDLKLLVARHSRHHGWHVEVLAEVLPATRDHDPRRAVAPADPRWVTAVELARGDATTTTLERLTGLYQALLPRLVVGHVDALDTTSPVSDGPVARRLRMVIEDERADLAEGLAALEALPAAGGEHAAERRCSRRPRSRPAEPAGRGSVRRRYPQKEAPTPALRPCPGRLTRTVWYGEHPSDLREHAPPTGPVALCDRQVRDPDPERQQWRRNESSVTRKISSGSTSPTSASTRC